jgi:hypothetical protein
LLEPTQLTIAFRIQGVQTVPSPRHFAQRNVSGLKILIEEQATCDSAAAVVAEVRARSLTGRARKVGLERVPGVSWEQVGRARTRSRADYAGALRFPPMALRNRPVLAA